MNQGINEKIAGGKNPDAVQMRARFGAHLACFQNRRVNFYRGVKP